MSFIKNKIYFFKRLHLILWSFDAGITIMQCILEGILEVLWLLKIWIRNASIIVRTNFQCVLKTLCANIGVNIRWVGFHDASIVVGTYFQCVLGWLYVGIVISTRLVRFHYTCIAIGAFFQCVSRRLCMYYYWTQCLMG